jgi:hypothetical protein
LKLRWTQRNGWISSCWWRTSLEATKSRCVAVCEIMLSLSECLPWASFVLVSFVSRSGVFVTAARMFW